jgi:hypothetical protein
MNSDSTPIIPRRTVQGGDVPRDTPSLVFGCVHLITALVGKTAMFSRRIRRSSGNWEPKLVREETSSTFGIRRAGGECSDEVIMRDCACGLSNRAGVQEKSGFDGMRFVGVTTSGKLHVLFLLFLLEMENKC